MTGVDSDAFDTFPRGRLSLKWDRRKVLSMFATELRVLADARHGGSAYKLSDLGNLPDDLLELMTPVIVPGCTITERQELMWGGFARSTRRVRLFSAASPARRVCESFDGRTPLGVIGRRLAEETGWEPTRAFAYTRGVFLHLVTLGFSLPR